MLDAFDLLLLTVLQHQQVINRERRIVMAVGVSRGDWQPHLFGEYAYGFLVFAFWGGGRRRSRSALRVRAHCAGRKDRENYKQ